MTDKKPSVIARLANPHSLAIVMLLITVRVTAGTIALAVRIPASIALARLRRKRRTRFVKW